MQSKPLPLDEDLPGMGQFYCDVTGCVQCSAQCTASLAEPPVSFAGGTLRTQRHWRRI